MHQTHERDENIPQHPQQHEHEKEEQKIDFIRVMQQQMCAGPSYLPNSSVCDLSGQDTLARTEIHDRLFVGQTDRSERKKEKTRKNVQRNTSDEQQLQILIIQTSFILLSLFLSHTHTYTHTHMLVFMVYGDSP